MHKGYIAVHFRLLTEISEWEYQIVLCVNLTKFLHAMQYNYQSMDDIQGRAKKFWYFTSVIFSVPNVLESVTKSMLDRSFFVILYMWLIFIVLSAVESNISFCQMKVSLNHNYPTLSAILFKSTYNIWSDLFNINYYIEAGHI